MRFTIFLALLAACTQNQDAKDFYDHAESGTTWQMMIADGKLVGEAYGTGYTGACPAFSTRSARVPDDGLTSCEPGCTCTLTFYLEDDGDVGHRYATDADFHTQCTDGSSLDCISPDPMVGEVGFCTWVSGKIDPSVDPFGDCSYTFTLVETQ